MQPSGRLAPEKATEFRAYQHFETNRPDGNPLISEALRNVMKPS
jgi:hypothetical protein